MHYIIFDLEATCWQGNSMDRDQEIIEIGAFRVNGYGEWKDRFQAFVKPTMHPRLSAYCTDLTGITQDQVNKAKTFGSVFHLFEDWFFKEDGPQLLCSWGAKDLDLVIDECKRHDLDHSFLPKCINLKSQYAGMFRLSKEVGLMKALEYLEIDFEGSHHRAIDDAFNTTKLFLHLLDRWQY